MFTDRFSNIMPPLVEADPYKNQLIDLLNEKIARLQQQNREQRKENNRLSRRIKELEKAQNNQL